MKSCIYSDICPLSNRSSPSSISSVAYVLRQTAYLLRHSDQGYCVGAATAPIPDLKKSRPAVHEMVRVRDRHGLYEVRGIDQRSSTVYVTRNLPKHPIKENVPLEAIYRLSKCMAQTIERFLNS